MRIKAQPKTSKDELAEILGSQLKARFTAPVYTLYFMLRFALLTSTRLQETNKPR